MTRTQRRNTLARQATELMMAAPQVVAHRVGRMAFSGLAPTVRDQREFHRMGSEKLSAFQESWMAMGLQGFAVQQQMAQAMLSLWIGWLQVAARPAGPRALSEASRVMQRQAASWQDMAVGLAGKGLAPVHRRAVANARRLNGGG